MACPIAIPATSQGCVSGFAIRQLLLPATHESARPSSQRRRHARSPSSTLHSDTEPALAVAPPFLFTCLPVSSTPAASLHRLNIFSPTTSIPIRPPPINHRCIAFATCPYGRFIRGEYSQRPHVYNALEASGLCRSDRRARKGRLQAKSKMSTTRFDPLSCRLLQLSIWYTQRPRTKSIRGHA